MATSDTMHDLKRATNRLAQWFGDVSDEEFLESRMMEAAAARKFTLIGDLCENLKQENPAIETSFPEIDDWIALRDQLIPAPVAEDQELLLDALNTRLPVLLERMHMLDPDVL